MNNAVRNFLLFIVLTITLGLRTAGVNISFQEDPYVNDKEEIVSLINLYFDKRYQSHQSLVVPVLSTFIEQSEVGNQFLLSENRKLEIELHFYSINNLKYQDYEYFISDINISFDMQNLIATVSLKEGHDVVFENLAPQVSKMRGLNHTFLVSKKSGDWKILKDEYSDYIWDFIKEIEPDVNQLIEILDSNSQYLMMEQAISSIELIEEIEPLSYGQNYSPYNRTGAVRYADLYALNPNPAYYNFDGQILGGDCTNYVSQAIHHGGQAPMAYYEPSDIGTAGWYYKDVFHRAAAWTDVGRLYQFIVDEHSFWGTGPEGVLSTFASMRPGDLIQFNWNTDNTWDHSVIVTELFDMGNGNFQILVNSHSPHHSHYPLNLFAPWKGIRYIHIERVRGHFTFLPLIIQNGGMYPHELTSDDNPYPAPRENQDPGALIIGESNSSLYSAYP